MCASSMAGAVMATGLGAACPGPSELSADATLDCSGRGLLNMVHAGGTRQLALLVLG